MSAINPSRFTTRPEISGTFGVVASTHWIATAVGMGVLERGGNAFDAGLATIFALQVVEPHLNGPGGDVPIMAHAASRGRTEVIYAAPPPYGPQAGWQQPVQVMQGYGPPPSANYGPNGFGGGFPGYPQPGGAGDVGAFHDATGGNVF